MRSKCLWIVTLGILASGGAQAQGLELRGSADLYFPSSGLWENQAWGGEIKLVHWYQDTTLGLGMALGYTRWKLSDNPVDQTATRTDVLSGYADYMPVGITALSRGNLSDNTNFMVTVETGLYYMLCNESMRMTRYLDAGGGTTLTQTSAVSCEDGVVGRIGVGLELVIHDDRNPTTLFLNVGYQYDIDKGRLSGVGWTGYSQDARLEGGYLQFGVAIPLSQ
ncbi:hypothetical protein ACFL6U_04450 [Planctomycetota bacterium]